MTEDKIMFIQDIIRSTQDKGCFVDVAPQVIQSYECSEINDAWHFYIPADDIEYAFSTGVAKELGYTNLDYGFLVDEAIFLSETAQWAIHNSCGQLFMLFAGTELASSVADGISGELFSSVDSFLDFYWLNDYQFSRDLNKDSSWMQRLMTHAYGLEKGFAMLEKAGLLR